MLDQYCRDRFGIPTRLEFDNHAKSLIEQFGKPDYQSSMKKLRFPCVYAFVRAGSIVYIGSSVNGFARVLASHHPMVTNAQDSDEIIFWVIGSEVEARDIEIMMIRAIKPRFNLNSNGEVKISGYGQRSQNFPELRRIVREAVRNEISSLVREGVLTERSKKP